MKIAVIGAGALGCIYASYLQKNNEVLLVDVNDEHVDAINNIGLRFIDYQGVPKIYNNLKATTDTSNYEPADIIILLTKCYQIDDALNRNKSLISESTILVTLQSGYGFVDDILEHISEERLVLGISDSSANIFAPGYVKQKGSGKTVIGCLSENQDNAYTIKEIFEESEIPQVIVNENIKTTIFEKLFAIIGINPICALIDDNNRAIVDNNFARYSSKMLVKEAVEIINASGMKFDFNEIMEHCLNVAEINGGALCTMLSDLRNKRRTEVDYFNGVIVCEAEKLGIKAPLNEMVTNIIHAKEEAFK